MPMPLATMEILREHRKPMTIYEIAAALEEKKYPFVSNNHPSSVYTGLKRRLETRNDVRRESPGRWILTEWYTADEIAEIDAKMGGKNGIDIFENAKKVSEALQKVKANGVKLGAPPKVSEQEKQNVKRLMESGVNPYDIARNLNVHRNSIRKWEKKWAKEAQTNVENSQIDRNT